MSFTHTNKVRYTYNAGGVNEVKEISLTKTGEAEINLDLTVTHTNAGGATHYIIPGFDFADASSAISTSFRLDGVNGAIYADATATAGTGATKLLDLDDGVPAVWSVNGSVAHPLGTANPFSPGGVDKDAIVNLTIKPDIYNDPDNLGNVVDGTMTLKVRVLYNPS